MPMLHGCAFPGCTTLTLSAYCVEHELLMRAMKESERQQEQASCGELAAEADGSVAAGAEAGRITQI